MLSLFVEVQVRTLFSPSPRFFRGQGRGEGQKQTPSHAEIGSMPVAAPNPLPVKNGEREKSVIA
jgi:hypothetical protein